MVAPFVTAGETVHHIDVLHAVLEHEGCQGRAETMGVDYLGETVESLQAELSALDPAQRSRLRAVGFTGQTDRRRDQRADRYHNGATPYAVYPFPR